MKNLIITSAIALGLFAMNLPASARGHDDRDRRDYRTEDAIRDIEAFYDQVSAERRDFGSTRHIDDELGRAHDDLAHIHSALRNHRDPAGIRDDVHQLAGDLNHIDKEIRSLGYQDRDRDTHRRGFTLRFGN